jgi:hypothetical protein
MNSLQSKMLAEMQDRSLFDQAQNYAFRYLDQVFQRGVYPSEAALEDLKIFEEPMPAQATDGGAALELLHRYGSQRLLLGHHQRGHRPLGALLCQGAGYGLTRSSDLQSRSPNHDLGGIPFSW